ncbi:hypothetical protein A5819_003583 [Enterococcus sp. 7E2_DIV0204]|uniref:hypothetical protein n=1 Tax=unclassified Enterococcus TaxID=2608891 RepID=UPI000B6B3A7A|nr:MULTISPECIES: hypothetical protein [unclassified Enterococcus]OTN84033.1 hypothetical protein A5819_003583 [Enterococcus sp. 7E2_DIV0204]OTP47184.1 hypothetical protein A5884_003559 [Enterococcus sp. 7D2_DIV0200]
MSKTSLTKNIEKALYDYCYDLGHIAVDEVTMPGNEGIVDTLSVEMRGNRSKGYEKIWRFYEIKVSKQDFYSKNKLTFLGHFNYFVLPVELYEVVIADIPKHIGVLTYSKGNITAKKKPIRQKELIVNEEVLFRNLVTSMNREVFKAKQIEKGLSIYNTETLMKEILKRTAKGKSDFLVDFMLETYAEDKNKFLSLLIDSSVSEDYKELVLSVLSQELKYLKEDVVLIKKDCREEKRQKRDAWLKIKQLENQLKEIAN